MYECHITLDSNPEELERWITAFSWNFSKIDGDPTLGRGVKTYATKHYNSEIHRLEKVIEFMNNIAKKFDGFGGAKVIRQKVELIVYDTKSGIGL